MERGDNHAPAPVPLPPLPAAVASPPAVTPAAAAPLATPIQVAPPPPALSPASAPPVVLRRPPPRGQTARRGIALAGLLAGLLAVFLILRPGGATEDGTTTPTAVTAAGLPTDLAAVTPSLPADASGSQPTSLPADGPASPPTAIPMIIPPENSVPTTAPVVEPTTAPVVIPTTVPAVESPADQVRTVLAAAVANGQVAQTTAEDLTDALDTLTDTDAKDRDTSKTLRAMERTLDQAERKGDIDSGVAAELRALLDQLATDEED